jgi:hypothetical protein
MSLVSQAREGGTTTTGSVKFQCEHVGLSEDLVCRMFSNLVNKASKFAMEGVKNLVVKQHVNPLI